MFNATPLLFATISSIVTLWIAFLAYFLQLKFCNVRYFKKSKAIDQQSIVIDKKTGLRGSVRKRIIGPMDVFEVPFDLFMRGLKISRNKPCFGRRKDFKSQVTWITYEKVFENIQFTGSALTALIPTSDELETRFIGICGRNSPQWVTFNWACMAYSLVSIPLYTTFGYKALNHILETTSLRILAVETTALARHILEAGGKYVKVVIIMEEDESLTEFKTEYEKQFKVFGFDEFLKFGQRRLLPVKKANPEDLVMLVYTSGSIGEPKGVMITNNAYLQSSLLFLSFANEIGISKEGMTHLSFLPLSHGMEQTSMLFALSNGARIGFLTSDIRHLALDFEEFKPTFFIAPPRLLMRVYSECMKKLRSFAPVRWLCEGEIHSRLEEQRRGIYRRNGLVDFLFFRKIRAKLGGNVEVILTGSAASEPEVINFFRAVFACPVSSKSLKVLKIFSLL